MHSHGSRPPCRCGFHLGIGCLPIPQRTRHHSCRMPTPTSTMPSNGATTTESPSCWACMPRLSLKMGAFMKRGRRYVWSVSAPGNAALLRVDAANYPGEGKFSCQNTPRRTCDIVHSDSAVACWIAMPFRRHIAVSATVAPRLRTSLTPSHGCSGRGACVVTGRAATSSVRCRMLSPACRLLLSCRTLRGSCSSHCSSLPMQRFWHKQYDGMRCIPCIPHSPLNSS